MPHKMIKKHQDLVFYNVSIPEASDSSCACLTVLSVLRVRNLRVCNCVCMYATLCNSL